ncbi:S8 family peptidase [Pseudocnuella soli]|uniref:S8 family peptidase n=1 Tax=Pseudocnuella soli TaxID=2502779 RepID=UPI00104A6A1B|nr:S8 family peptidase [Pseudocnuella soli]
MSLKTAYLFTIACCCFLFSAAQKTGTPIMLKTGTLQITAAEATATANILNKRLAQSGQPELVLLQFAALPNAAARQQLAAQGVELLQALPGNAFTALIHKPITWQQLTYSSGAQGITPVNARQKTDPQLWPQAFGISVKSTLVNVWVRLHPGTTEAQALAVLQSFGTAKRVFIEEPVYALQISETQIAVLAAHSRVAYVQPQPPPAQPLLQDSRTSSGAALLQASAANGGRGLSGQGVVVGIGDNGDVQTHLDFSGRLINRVAGSVQGHATHVTGITAGAAVMDERYLGFAPRATVVSQVFEGIFTQAGQYVADHGMVITNNSYGNVLNCTYNGVYDFYSSYLDGQAFLYPSLLHVFAAGNSGGNTCQPYEIGFGTVLGSYQSAKNVLSVGNVDDLGLINGGSSRGPVKDGRIKPEIVAIGTNVAASWPTNGYGNNSGTSMAAPAVAGGAALLVERYRQLHGGKNPGNALLKAILCNGASDRGNAGPDFRYGFGYMNLNRSLDILEKNHIIQDSIANGQKNTHRISVPTGTAQVKVMLYWNDPAASHLSRRSLVHDLDLTLSAGGTQYLPFILDTAAAALNTPATTGADHRNNIEQVVVKNPGATEFSIEIKGFSVAGIAKQQYVVVYDLVPNELLLTAPAGGERFDTSEVMRVQWEAAGLEDQTLSLEFSADGGATWQTAATGIAAASQFYRYKLPNIPAPQARIRLVTAGGAIAASKAFVLGIAPKSFSLTNSCEGYLVARWRKAAEATGYEVLRFAGTDWRTMATTTDTAFTLAGLAKDSAYPVAVRAMYNGIAGQRCPTLVRTPSGGNCAGNISDGDLKLDALIAPVTARQFTPTAPTPRTQVSIRIKNLDNAPVTGFQAYYSSNGGQTWISETVQTTIPAQGLYTYHFQPYANLGNTGAYEFVVVVKNIKGDVNPYNDTLRTVVRHLKNDPIDLTTPYFENFDDLSEFALPQSTVGLAGLERFDFFPGTANGRLRSYAGSGMAKSGNRAITLDSDRERSAINRNFLVATFNLSAYDAAANEVRLDFAWAAHGMDTANRVWVRGSEADEWILAYTFPLKGTVAGTFKQSPSLRISHLLTQAGQRFSTATQIRWEQTGTKSAVQANYAGGYTIDDLRLYRVRSDVQLVSVDGIDSIGCGRSSAEQLTLTIVNGTGQDITTVPVRYSINGGGWATENIPLIKANDTIRYSFNQKLNLSKPGDYGIRVALGAPFDEVRQNDSLQLLVRSQAVISQFPYLQRFEGENDGWYSEGRNNSWELGQPASFKITRAASGSNVWKTNLTGNHNNNELSYLYTPCLQTGNLQQPTLSFHVVMDLEECVPACDNAWVEYSADGETWQKLDGEGTNWYPQGDSWHVGNDIKWHVATVALPAGVPQLKLRFVFSSDPGVNNEGIALDDIHVYDNTMGIYTGPSMGQQVLQNVGGQNEWMHFTQNGRLLASLQLKGVSLASTGVRTYIHPGEARFSKDQYYHNRNLVVDGATSDSVRVRFYFTEAETKLLLAANNCASCAPPESVLDLGVTLFKPVDAQHLNGTLDDDKVGFWHYVPVAKTALVPYDAGYYLEFDAVRGTEMWLNSGGLSREASLPVKFVQLKASKTGVAKDVLLQWDVAGENGVLRYEVEVARGVDAPASHQFQKLGEPAAQGSTDRLQYQFTDTELPKMGMRHYRLRVIDQDGGEQYSPQVSVRFDINAGWQVFPNPSVGEFYLMFELAAGEAATLRLTDAVGRVLKTMPVRGTGQGTLMRVDLSGGQFPPGVYLLQCDKNDKVFRLLKRGY